MKHTFLFRTLSAGLLSLASCSALHAQDTRFEIGLTGGPSLSKSAFTADSGATEKSLLAGVVGLSFQYNASRILSVHTGLNYERKGAREDIKYSGNGSNATLIGKLKFDYLVLPVMLRAHVGDRVRAFADAGAYAGYLFNGVVSLEDQSGVNSFSVGIDDQLKKIDFGIAGGLGVSVPVGNNLGIGFETRGNLGLVDISKPSTKTVTPPSEIKNRTLNFLFSLAYRF